jgi:hypothetical protein
VVPLGNVNSLWIELVFASEAKQSRQVMKQNFLDSLLCAVDG